ncbi:uncharacterized protein METZ01_LOCUS381391 [marine metagenome]|uniref:Response regulatory domain-containing protein n=1 Tax=marine metagenome TaxID=408172 RepID=A0A382U3I9_9ZZZZ
MGDRKPIVVKMLGDEGYRVDSAAHPTLAAEQSLSDDYDLITLDLNLDEQRRMSGTC